MSLRWRKSAQVQKDACDRKQILHVSPVTAHLLEWLAEDMALRTVRQGFTLLRPTSYRVVKCALCCSLEVCKRVAFGWEELMLPKGQSVT